MNILVAHGSKRGGTAGIASVIGAALRGAGVDADVLPAREVRDVRKYDAVVIGGALYAMLWHEDARRFVIRHAAALRERPVWFFSSGPLDDSAASREIPPTPDVQQLMDFVGASGHATFGGRLEPDAHGCVASKMAKHHAGDFSNHAQIAAWARRVAGPVEIDVLHGARRAWKPLPSRARPVALSLVAGLPALFCGASLVLRPDGSGIGLPLSLLQRSPFHDFLVPGILLFGVIGVGSTWSALLHFARSNLAGPVSFVSGAALVVWIVVEMIMLCSMHPLQVAYLILGVWIAVESLRGYVRMMMPPVGGSPPATSPG